MDTESGFEEFVLWVSEAVVMTVMRQDNQCMHKHNDWDEPPHGTIIVKAYAPEKWQGYPYVPGNRDDVVVGYQEARLTERQRENVIDYVYRYWDIPF